MPRLRLAAPLAALCLATQALGQGDPARGARDLARCASCHSVVAHDGRDIVKGASTAPNLFGILGRKAASADFRYGSGLTAAGQKGLVWDAETLDAYVRDPVGFLRDQTGDPAAKSLKTFKVRAGGKDIAAWLAEVAAATP